MLKCKTKKMKITENCGKHFQLNMQIVLMMLQKCQLAKILR